MNESTNKRKINAIILLDDLTKEIDESWRYFFILHNQLLLDILLSINWKKQILPPSKYIFRVFNMNLNDIKIVLLGQDPYYNLNQANGFAFSVNKNLIIPPSLQNIFKEIKLEFPEREYNFIHGDISRWFTDEKIFLLNSALTVEESNPGYHLKLWEKFLNKVINFISIKNTSCVFLLLGNSAGLKDKYINNKSRCIYGIHPSPLSSYKGFFNSGIFQKVENKLGYPINWSL
jgi:uracil-DNA glycosylase